MQQLKQGGLSNAWFLRKQFWQNNPRLGNSMSHMKFFLNRK